MKTFLFVTAAVALLLSPLNGFSQDAAPRMADGRPDLTGYWRTDRSSLYFWHLGKDLPERKLPLNAAGEAALKHNQTATIDPISLCIIGGMPRRLGTGMAFEIVQTGKKVAFLYGDGTYRLIPIDPNRKHSEDPDPTFWGESIGRWEGNTFVIDSVGFKDEKIWIDEYAHPMSSALHLVERWTRPDTGHVHVDAVVEDPTYYTKPVTYSRTWNLDTTGEQVPEFSCSENNVDKEFLGFGPGDIRDDGTIGYVDPAPLPPPIPKSPAPGR